MPLVLFAIPNSATEENDYEIAVPYAGSLLIRHSLDGTFPGLSDYPPEDRPNLYWPFYGFRLMVGIGFAMIGLAFWGVWLWWRGKLESAPLFTQIASLSWPFGFVAIIAGWTVAETGRQPWLATGILRTVDAASPVPAEAIAASLALFIVAYTIIFTAGIIYINRLINAGPAIEPAPVEGVPNRPISAAGGAGKKLFGEEGAGNA